MVIASMGVCMCSNFRQLHITAFTAIVTTLGGFMPLIFYTMVDDAV